MVGDRWWQRTGGLTVQVSRLCLRVGSHVMLVCICQMNQVNSCKYFVMMRALKLHWWCSTVLTADVRSTLVMCALPYTPLLHVRDYDQRTTVTSSSQACGWLVLAATASVCVDRQSGTNSHRICEDTRELFKRSLKSWLFKCVYSRRHVIDIDWRCAV